MKTSFSERMIAYLALLSGLSISAVAVYYSVAGLVSIFAASVIPIIVMGVTLEVSKLIATMWLKINWFRAPALIKSYLIAAITILMVITSMGIFGYLSKAHSDQSLISGDVTSKVAILDEKIKIQQENINAARKALAQMDATVDQTIGRSTSESGARRAAQLRRSQAKERTALQNEILQAQERITALNDERAPFAAELRKVEAEVGPIKYIAALIYGDNPDANLLERAVTWVIIIIVIVFDPLAVVLLLASQYSFQWFRQDRLDAEQRKIDEEQAKVKAEEEREANELRKKIERQRLENELAEAEAAKLKILDDQPSPIIQNIVADPVFFEPANDDIAVEDKSDERFVAEVPKEDVERLTEETRTSSEEITEQEVTTKIAEAEQPEVVEEVAINEAVVEDTVVEDVAPLERPGDYLQDGEIADILAKTGIAIDDDLDEDNDANPTESYYMKLAKSKWKKEHPENSLKHQRELLQKGIIQHLPWETVEYLEEVEREEAIKEATKWALEQVDDSKKKETVSWMEKNGNQQIRRTKEL